MIRLILSYLVLGLMPVYQLLCYVILQRNKDQIIRQKRDIKMIYVSTIAAWLAYVNFINSLFGGIYCGLYHSFVILLPPLSVGPQLLRGIRLWGLLERNKMLLKSYHDSEDQLRMKSNIDGSGNSSSLHVINEASSSIDEHSQMSDIHIHVNRRNSVHAKINDLKMKVFRMVGFARLLLILLPTMLILALLTITDGDQLGEVKFDKCFPEPSFVLNVSRVSTGIFSIATFCCTVLLSRCNDELGISKEIIRNVAILFVSNLVSFVCRHNDLFHWQAFVYAVQQIMVSFSMIVVPNLFYSDVITWMHNRSKRLIPGYAGPRPQLHHSRGSILISGNRLSQVDQSESSKREREVTMSLGASLCILLSSNSGIEAFTEHCSREFSVENVKFWSEVNEFHKAVDVLRDGEGVSNHDENDVLIFAKEIYQTFIMEGADMQINISADQAKTIKERLESNGEALGRDVFDEAQAEIYSLMSQHSYPRFLSSKSCKNYKKRMEDRARAKKSKRRNSTAVHPS